jgi:glycosyltransferase involved in cell wall biosynthesis
MTAIAGSAVYCEELALRLQASGHDVSVLCFGANQRLLERCRVTAVGRSPWRGAPLAWRAAFHMDERHAAREMSNARLEKPDVVIALEHLLLRAHNRRFPATPWLYVPLSLIAPLEIRSYGLGPLATRLGTAKFHRLQQWALQHADATIRFNQMSCRLLESHYGEPCARRFIVCDMPIGVPATSEATRSSGPLRLLSVGRIAESKNVGGQLRALAQLKEYAWTLDVVGEGQQLGAVRQLVQELELQDRVTCHGRVPSPEEWYSRADLMLFTSKLDNCPLVVLESMGYGVPVLAIRPDGVRYVSGVEEMISDGVDGLLADGEHGFVERLREVFENPASLAHLGRAARRRVLDRHTWESHAAFFNRMLAEQTGQPQPSELAGALANGIELAKA